MLPMAESSATESSVGHTLTSLTSTTAATESTQQQQPAHVHISPVEQLKLPPVESVPHVLVEYSKKTRRTFGTFNGFMFCWSKRSCVSKRYDTPTTDTRDDGTKRFRSEFDRGTEYSKLNERNPFNPKELASNSSILSNLKTLAKLSPPDSKDEDLHQYLEHTVDQGKLDMLGANVLFSLASMGSTTKKTPKANAGEATNKKQKRMDGAM